MADSPPPPTSSAPPDTLGDQVAAHLRRCAFCRRWVVPVPCGRFLHAFADPRRHLRCVDPVCSTCDEPVEVPGAIRCPCFGTHPETHP